MIEKITDAFANIHRVVKTDEDLEWNRAVWRCTEIVQEVAKEYGTVSDNDLAVVSALPSLYPLRPFEEEAIHKVVASAKDGGWIPANVTPKKAERYLCDVIFLWEGSVENKVVIAKYDNYWHIADGNEILAWQPLPAPYQKRE